MPSSPEGRLAEMLRPNVSDPALVAESVATVLADTDLCSIATVTESSAPHISTAYFAHVGDLIFYVLTAPSSLHAVSWQRDPRVAVAVFASTQPWGVPHRGLQMTGVAACLPDSQQSSAFEAYAQVHPRIRTWARDGAELLATLESRLYAIQVDRLTLSDESVFGEGQVSVEINRRGKLTISTTGDEQCLTTESQS